MVKRLSTNGIRSMVTNPRHQDKKNTAGQKTQAQPDKQKHAQPDNNKHSRKNKNKRIRTTKTSATGQTKTSATGQIKTSTTGPKKQSRREKLRCELQNPRLRCLRTTLCMTNTPAARAGHTDVPSKNTHPRGKCITKIYLCHRITAAKPKYITGKT